MEILTTIVKSYVIPALPLIPLLIGLLKFKQLSTAQKWLVAWMGMCLLLWGVGHVMSIIWGSNLPAFHVYVCAEFCFLVTVYREGIDRFISKKGYLYLLGGFTALFLLNGIWGMGFRKMPSITLSLEALTVISFSFIYFAGVFREMKVTHLEREFMLWFSTGNLLFFSGNSLLYIFSAYISQQSYEVAHQIWGIRSGLLIFIYLMYTIALLCKEKTPH